MDADPKPPRTAADNPARQREARRQAAVARLGASRLRLYPPPAAPRPFGLDMATLATLLSTLVQGHPVASAAAAAGLGAMLARLRPWRWLSALGTLAGPALVALGTRQLSAWLAALQTGATAAAAASDRSDRSARDDGAAAAQTSTRASKNA